MQEWREISIFMFSIFILFLSLFIIYHKKSTEKGTDLSIAVREAGDSSFTAFSMPFHGKTSKDGTDFYKKYGIMEKKEEREIEGRDGCWEKRANNSGLYIE